jgi:hypothetical protein
MTRSTTQPSTRRWDGWQDSATNQRFLSLAARRKGYTVVYVPPPCREAFLELAGLMSAYGYLPQTPELVSIWQRWLTTTKRLAAYLKRVRAGKSAVCPDLGGSDADHGPVPLV